MLSLITIEKIHCERDHELHTDTVPVLILLKMNVVDMKGATKRKSLIDGAAGGYGRIVMILVVMVFVFFDSHP